MTDTALVALFGTAVIAVVVIGAVLGHYAVLIYRHWRINRKE